MPFGQYKAKLVFDGGADNPTVQTIIDSISTHGMRAVVSVYVGLDTLAKSVNGTVRSVVRYTPYDVAPEYAVQFKRTDILYPRR